MSQISARLEGKCWQCPSCWERYMSFYKYLRP